MNANKFNGFGPVYVINLKQRKDRRKYIKEHFKQYGIKQYTIIPAVDGVSDRKEIDRLLHEDSRTDNLRDPEVAVILSHLQAIKYWLDNSNSLYAIFCEDDVDLRTSEFWSFTWRDFISHINFPFDIIQMSITNPIQIPLHKRRRHKEYSAGCYLITRDYAKRLIDKHLFNGKYKIVGSRINIVADELIYDTKLAYSVGLFTYRNKESNINPDKINGAHERSIGIVMDYWKSNSSIPLDHKMQTDRSLFYT